MDELMQCNVCRGWFDPTILDQVLYHERHLPVGMTGIVGRRVDGPHPSHKTRFSDASTFDEICVFCGAHDEVPGGWGSLADPCPKEPPEHKAEREEADETRRAIDEGLADVDAGRYEPVAQAFAAVLTAVRRELGVPEPAVDARQGTCICGHAHRDHHPLIGYCQVCDCCAVYDEPYRPGESDG